MSRLAISQLSRSFGNFRAVDDFSLDVASGEFISLLGPSGCGKSTILRMIAGLLEPDSGVISIDDTDVTWLPPEKRNIGLVFQSYALFPHMSVSENVAFGLRRRGVPNSEIKTRVGEALELVQLSGLGDRFPREMSGGQQQRVALARAVAPQPALLLLDEPLSNLDALLRDAMRFELRKLQQELSITTIFVTHDQEEALTMSDRICVLAGGQLHQVGPPRAIYETPATPFVAEFFGRSNGFDGKVASLGETASVSLSDNVVLKAAHIPDDARIGDPVHVTIRQESVQIPAPGNVVDTMPAQLDLVSFAGPTAQFLLKLPDGLKLNGEMNVERGGRLPEAGGQVQVAIDPKDVIVMARAH